MLTVVLVLTVTGCSSDAKRAVQPAAPGTVKGGTITMAIGQPGSVDPGNAYEPVSQFITHTMCDTLFTLDARTGDLKPALAESVQVTDRGTKFVIRLRKNLHFADGSRLTADDVVASLTRIASTELASGVADLMKPVLGYEYVHGDKATDKTERISKLRGLKIIDGRSFEMKLGKDPSPLSGGRVDLSLGDFVRVLAHPATAPVPRKLAVADPDRFGRQPVCAGPYQLAAPWSPDQRTITLVRSKVYDAVNEGFTAGGAGYANRIVFRVEPDAAARSAAFDRGEVDVAPAPPADVARLRATDAARLVDGVTPAVEYVGIPANGLLDNPLARQALSEAIDRTAIAAAVNGTARPATGFLPPTLGREIARRRPCGDTLPARADVQRARATIQRAKVELGQQPLSLFFNDELGNRALVEAVAAQWTAAFGVAVNLQPMPWDQFLARGIGAGGFAGAFRLSWRPRYPGPDQYVTPLFTGTGIGEANFARFSNVALDLQVSRRARRALEPEEQALEYQRVEDGLCHAMPMIPVVYGVAVTRVAKDRVAAAASTFTERGTGEVALRELYRTDGSK